MRAALLSLVLLASCTSYDDLALLDVEHIEPPEIEPGTTLRIRGQGFPLGRDPSVVIRGFIHRPGVARTSVEVSLLGSVRSESLIEVPVSGELIDAIGGRATLDGEVRVAFAAADARREVFAAEPARLDFLPDTEMQLRAEGIQDELEGPSATEAFGLRLSREELGSAGVRVESVIPASLAAQQGMKAGDTVIALDGLSIYSWRDFAPDPTKTESRVVVARAGLRTPHALRWPHEVSQHSSGPLALAVFVLVGLLLGWGSPAALALAPRQQGSSIGVWLLRASLIGGVSALILFVPSLQWITMWILVLGTFAALFALATRQRAATVSFALAVGAALTVMLLTASASVAEILAAQSPGIMRWYVFQSPAAFLAFGAYLYATSAIASSPRLSASLYVAPVAVLGSVLFLGGWPLGAPLAGAAVVFGKALLILLAARALEARSDIGAFLCAGGLCLAFIGMGVDLGELFPQWSALAIGLFSGLAVRALVPPLRRPASPVPA